MSLSKGVTLLVAHAKRHKHRRGAPKVEDPASNRQEISFALNYLDAFGYLSQALSGWKDLTIEDLIEGVKKFQGMAGLPKTGDLCAKVVKVMELPRCGHPDFLRDDNVQYMRVKEFVEQARLSSWTKRALTYAVTDYLPGWNKADQDNVIAAAFKAWTQYGNIECVQVAAKNADIIISVGEGARSNFDGPGGVLAWAYLPDGNDRQLLMKFDLAETWVLSPNLRGIVLMNVACHEFGHLFGLDHSRVDAALMAPFYNVQIAVPQQNDDVPRFTARYGVRTLPPVVPTLPPVVPPAPGTPTGAPAVDPVEVTVQLGKLGRWKGRLTLDPTSLAV